MNGAGSRGWWILVALLPALVIFAVCLADALAWIGRPFAGFFFLENAVIVSIGRTEWLPPQSRKAQWTRLLAVDGHPVRDGREAHAYVRAAGIGNTVTYSFRRGTEIFRLALPVRPFRVGDFLELFAPMLAIGLLMQLTGAAVLSSRPGASEARALFAFCLAAGLMLVTGPDEYAPYRFTSVYFLSQCAVPPAVIQLALSYPPRSGLLRRGFLLYLALYLPFAGLGVTILTSMSDPSLFLLLLYALYFFIANAALLYVGGLVFALIEGLRPRTPVVLALAAAVGSSSLTLLILVTYPLLQRPISPIVLLGPLLLMPVLTGLAFVRFPTPAADPLPALVPGRS